MSHKILFIDQSEHYIQMVLTRLFNYGYKDVAVAHSAKDGFSLIKTFHPDVIIVDTQLQDLDGYRLCRHLKNVYGDTIKIILIANLAEKFDSKKSKIVEADEYIPKAYDCLPLLTAIKRQLALLKESPSTLAV